MQRFLPSAFVFAGLLILLGLGTWQLQRLAWKEALIAQREAGLAAPPVGLPSVTDDWRRFDFRAVGLEGRFRHDLEQLFGVEARNNVLGYHVLTPMVRTDGPAILIDRGWVPAGKAHPAARREGQTSGKITLDGIARYRLDDRPNPFTPANDPSSGHWYHYDLPAMESALGLDLAPLVIEADATPNPGGLPIGGGAGIALANNHLQYAITWYGLAVALVGVYILFRRHHAQSRKSIRAG
jgi:surfeit locus 1 family protein